VPCPVWETPDIFAAAKSILDGIRLEQAVRLAGVSLANLEAVPRQLPLFPERLRVRRLTRAMDTVNSRYGDFTLTWGSLLELERHDGVISPAWRPEGTRKIIF
jgi:DNA polymerase-4